MSAEQRVRDAVLPVLGELGVSLYDLEVGGGVVRITVSAEGGIGTELLTTATRAVSTALDEADPLAGSYTLEVSSPGLERALRTPEHFAGAVGEQVRIKTRAGSAEDGDRRLEGIVVAVAEHEVVVRTTTGEARVDLADIERARTVFEWGPAPKPGGPKQSNRKRS